MKRKISLDARLPEPPETANLTDEQWTRLMYAKFDADARIRVAKERQDAAREARLAAQQSINHYLDLLEECNGQQRLDLSDAQ